MKVKKAIINIILITLLIMCMGYGLAYKNNAQSSKTLAAINIEDTGREAASIEEMLNSKEEDNYSFVALKEKDEVIISNEELKKSTSVKLISITGNSSILFRGPILFTDDKDGCLIDKSAAYKLFGDYNVEGMTVQYDGNNYTIRGVIENAESSIVIQTKTNSNLEMDLLLLDMNGEDDRYVENFLTKYSLPQNYTTNSVYYSISNLMTLVLPIIMACIIINKMFKLIRINKNKPIKKILLILLTLVFIYFLYLILNIKFKINYNLIPNEWSDFDYWGDLISKYSERNRELLFSKKYVIDIPLIDNMIRSVFCSIVCIITFFILNNRMKPINIKYLLKILGVIVIIELIAIYLINKDYNLSNYMIIYLIPYYYVCTYFIEWLINKESYKSVIE